MPVIRPKPFWETTDKETVVLYQGDVLETLKRLPSGSVQCCITSPPYWGLRDYGTGTWEGGDPNCNHELGVNLDDSDRLEKQKTRDDKEGKYTHPSSWNGGGKHGDRATTICGKCGAKRTDHQLGSEKSPDCGQLLNTSESCDGEILYLKRNCAEDDWENGCHVCRMVLVFREVRRVLRDDGTLWLNYGDSYSGGSGGDQTKSVLQRKHLGTMIAPRPPLKSMKSGNLVGVPWRVALALQADGWILRQDIPWVKRSAMPESVKNRPAKALEYVFLFVKKMGYFYDFNAIKKGGENGEVDRRLRSSTFKKVQKIGHAISSEEYVETTGRNFRNADLWFESVEPPHGLTGVGDEIVGLDVTSENYPGAHFATFGTRLITPMIKAGTSEKGCCSECGAPWKRVIEEKKLTRERPNDYVKRTGEEGTGNTCANSVAGVETRTVGWEPSCECNGRFEKRKVLKKTAKVGERNNTSWAVGQESHNVKNYQTEEGRENDRISSEEYERTVSEYVCNCGVRWGVTGKTDNSTWEDRKQAGACSGSKTVGMNTNHGKGMSHDLDPKPFRSIEREMPCNCYEDKIVPCVVMDPFCGSGTTNAVCIALGRNSIGIELSRDYLIKNAITRIEGELLARPALAYLVPRAARKSTIVGEDITG